MEEQRVQAHLNAGRESPSGWKKTLHTAKRGVAGHPWMAFAAVLSMAAPLVVALFPLYPSKSSDGSALDSLPMPAAISVHDQDSTAGPSAEGVEPNRLETMAPRALEPGWDVAPTSAGGHSARQADFRDDTDAAGGVQAVGSNRPAATRSRGAWLTGTIEEDPPEATERPSRGTARQ